LTSFSCEGESGILRTNSSEHAAKTVPTKNTACGEAAIKDQAGQE